MPLFGLKRFAGTFQCNCFSLTLCMLLLSNFTNLFRVIRWSCLPSPINLNWILTQLCLFFKPAFLKNRAYVVTPALVLAIPFKEEIIYFIKVQFPQDIRLSGHNIGIGREIRKYWYSIVWIFVSSHLKISPNVPLSFSSHSWFWH